jgi:predicted XRE-type DNA-binding protein
MTTEIAIIEGGPNIFADLGLPDAEELLVKAKLAHRIARILKDRGLTQSEAAALIGLPQPKLSNMLRGRFHGISEDKMMRCLAALGHDVTITVSARGTAQGRVEVAYG